MKNDETSTLQKYLLDKIEDLGKQYTKLEGRVTHEITENRRAAKLVYILVPLAVAIVGGLVTFFGYDKYETIENELRSRMNAKFDSLSQQVAIERLDSLQKERTRMEEITKNQLNLLETTYAEAGSQIEGVKRAVANMTKEAATTKRNLKKEAVALKTDMRKTAATLKKDLLNIKKNVDVESQKVGASLKETQIQLFLDKLEKTSPNDKATGEEVFGLDGDDYDGISDHSLFDIEYVSKQAILVKVTKEGTGVSKYWWVAISKIEDVRATLHSEYFVSKNGMNRLNFDFAQFSPGDYRIQLSLITITPDNKRHYYIRHKQLTLPN